jgi:hypothetical protein
VTKNETPPHPVGTRGRFWQYQDLLTPSPSRATHPVPAILRGAEHFIREAVGDEDHFAFVDLVELDHALTCNLIGARETCQPIDDFCGELVTYGVSQLCNGHLNRGSFSRERRIEDYLPGEL